jgi:hypothetical protein
MDVYVERDLPRWQITGFLRAAGSHEAQKVLPGAGWVIRCLAPLPSLALGAALRAFDAVVRRRHGDPESDLASQHLQTGNGFAGPFNAASSCRNRSTSTAQCS